MDAKMTLILPMAGHGQRFRDAGYAAEKPLIEVCGRTLLDWSLTCVDTAFSRDQMLAVIRSDQDPKLERAIRERGIFPVILSGSTPGAACTVLAAAVGLRPDAPVAAMNCDQIFDCDLEAANARMLSEDLSGYILTFPGTGPAWSYAVTNGGDRVVSVIEKKQVSPFATVGFYAWRRAADLVRSICATIASRQTTNGEYYLAPSFCQLPLDSHDVRAVPTEGFVGLGTPEQVAAFKAGLATRKP